MVLFRRRWPTLLVIALTVSLLTTLGQATLAKPANETPDLRGSWSLDEGSGTVAKDSSAYRNHGSIVGATWVSGKFGTALAFDGSTKPYDRVTIPRSPSLEPEHVSLALWFRTSVKPARWNVLAFKGVINGLASSYALKADASGEGLVFMAYNGVENIWTDAKTGLWDGQWHHAVGTYDGKSLRLYVDGERVGSATVMNGGIQYGLEHGNDLIIGHPVTTYVDPQYSGDIDEVQVWDRALSGKEIARLANPDTGKKPRR